GPFREYRSGGTTEGDRNQHRIMEVAAQLGNTYGVNFAGARKRVTFPEDDCAVQLCGRAIGGIAMGGD
ncbi:MAG TPA: hypothetical protein VF657_25720, partial [Actinoplanes sp.]